MRINIRQLFIFILFTGLFIMTLRPVVDPDFWWHLRTGQLIAETQKIPHSDPFSSTYFGKPWTAHEWLAELGIYFFFRIGGPGLLIFVFSLVVTGASLLVYFTCSSASRPYAAGFAVLLGGMASAPAWGVRPQMITLLFFGLSLFLLERYGKTRQLRFLIPIPLLSVLWVNLHAGYFVLFAGIGIYMIGEALEYLPNLRRKERHSLRPFVALGVTLAASALAALANPNGYHILIYPFQTLTSPSMQQFIQEWFSPDFHLSQWQPLAWFILALIGTSMLGRRPVSPTRILLTVLFGYAALRSMRNVPLFALAATPALAEQLASFFATRTQVPTPPRFARWLNPAVMALAVLLAGVQFISTVSRQTQSEQENFPAAAADWILDNRPPGSLYNTYGWGGYLIWRLHPEYPVYIDGRADVYGDQFIYEYVGIYHAEPGWQAGLDAAQVNTLLVERGEPLAIALAGSPIWIEVFQDRASVVFVRASPIAP